MVKNLQNQILKFRISEKRAFFLFILLMVSAFNFSFAAAYHNSTKAKYKKSFKPDSIQKEVISFRAANEIKNQAEAVVHIYEIVLNSISFEDNSATELASYIKNSYTPNKRYRVFYSSNVIIEDDLDPKAGFGASKDIPADKYLDDFDLNYEKTRDFSIRFSNIETSNVKKTDHIYVRVKFDSNFGGKYKVDGSRYQVRKREALVRMVPNGKKKWTAIIEGISYFDPNRAITSKENDMQVDYNSALDNEDDDSEKIILAKNRIVHPEKSITAANEKAAQYPDFGFDFKNFQSPEITKNNPIFHIKITFESDFGIKDTVTKKLGPLCKGEACLRVERNGNTKWNAVIETISFRGQKKSGDNKDKDLKAETNDPAMVAGVTNLPDESIKMALLPSQGESKKEIKKAK